MITTPVVKRSVSIAGHRTSISLEQPFWDALQTLASWRGVSVQRLVGEIDAARGEANLSSAIRVAVLRAALDGALTPALARVPSTDAPHEGT